MAEATRPPPGVCDEVSATLGAHGAGSLRQLLDEHPMVFDQLLLHTKTCSICLSIIDETFPEGFASPETEAELDAAVARLADAAETPAQAPREGETGT